MMQRIRRVVGLVGLFAVTAAQADQLETVRWPGMTLGPVRVAPDGLNWATSGARLGQSSIITSFGTAATTRSWVPNAVLPLQRVVGWVGGEPVFVSAQFGADSLCAIPLDAGLPRCALPPAVSAPGHPSIGSYPRLLNSWTGSAGMFTEYSTSFTDYSLIQVARFDGTTFQTLQVLVPGGTAPTAPTRVGVFAFDGVLPMWTTQASTSTLQWWDGTLHSRNTVPLTWVFGSLLAGGAVLMDDVGGVQKVSTGATSPFGDQGSPTISEPLAEAVISVTRQNDGGAELIRFDTLGAQTLAAFPTSMAPLQMYPTDERLFMVTLTHEVLVLEANTIRMLGSFPSVGYPVGARNEAFYWAQQDSVSGTCDLSRIGVDAGTSLVAHVDGGVFPGGAHNPRLGDTLLVQVTNGIGYIVDDLPDAGPVDAGIPDAGSIDSGVALDAGAIDAGSSEDAGMVDAGIPDAGAPDAGGPVIDAGMQPDAGRRDAGTSIADAGTDTPKPPEGCGCSAGEGLMGLAWLISAYVLRRRRALSRQ